MASGLVIFPEERQSWLGKRQSGIGGSDAAAVLGLSPWKSRLALWAEKTGKVDRPNLDELEWIEWGNVLEEPIAQKYVQVTGRKLVDWGRFAIRISPTHRFMHCTIDREIQPFDGQPECGDLSIKNVGFFKLKDWETEAPLQYQVQLQHELAVTGLQWGSFAVLIGGQKFAWLDSPRNEKFIAHLIEKEEEFWNLVQRDIPPETDGSDSTREVLARLYPSDMGEAIALPVELADLAEERRNLKEHIAIYQKRAQDIENRIKAALGNASVGVFPDGSGFSWKQQHRNETIVKASDFRVLREIKAKKG